MLKLYNFEDEYSTIDFFRVAAQNIRNFQTKCRSFSAWECKYWKKSSE